ILNCTGSTLRRVVRSHPIGKVFVVPRVSRAFGFIIGQCWSAILSASKPCSGKGSPAVPMPPSSSASRRPGSGSPDPGRPCRHRQANHVFFRPRTSAMRRLCTLLAAGSLLVTVLLSLAAAPPAPVAPGAEDEKALQVAKVGTQTPALLDYLRQ